MRFFLIFTTLILLVSTTITELYLKHIGLGDPVRYDSDYIYGFAPKENQKKIRFDGSLVSINDVGLRTHINWKNNSKKKIVFLGDSITYGGSYIDDKKLFSNLVCEKINSYICGNAGVNAYSIINMVMRSRYDERFNESEKYIFTVAPGDFYREYIGANSLHFYLNKKEFFLPAITEALSFIGTRYDINRYLSKHNDTNKENVHKKELINFSIELLHQEIKRLKYENKEVFVFYTVEKDDKDSLKKTNKYILNKIKNLNLKNFYNLNKTLNDNKYFYDSVHYNELGHRKVAEKIISVLTKY